MYIKLLFYLIFIIPLTSSFTLAADSDLCRDLAKFACAPGTYSDGTGTTKNTLSLPNEKSVKEINDRVKAELFDAFKKALENPANASYQQVVLKAFGLTEAPDCQSNDKKEKGHCIELAADAMTDQVLPRISSTASVTLDDLTFKQADPLKGAIVDLDAALIDPETRKIALSISSETRKQLYDVKLDEKIKAKVNEIKGMLIERVQFGVKEQAVRDRMVEKIRSIEFKGSDCTELFPRPPFQPKRTEANPEISIAGFIVPNAFYNPEDNSFRFCNGFKFLSDSDFSTVHIIAHELAHSIDPCDISKEINANGKKLVARAYSNPSDIAQDEKEFPFSGLVGCLRDPSSINAIHGQLGMAKNTFASSLHGAPEGVNAFCSNDQVNEAYADLMGFDILADYSSRHLSGLSTEQKRVGYSNTFRSACNYMEYVNGVNNRRGAVEVHSSSPDRINSILLANPKVREQMHCNEPSIHKDCSQFISPPDSQKISLPNPSADTVK